jgi:hypothetical protein
MVIFIPSLDFGARPRSFAQKAETGLDAGIELKTANWNVPPHHLPTMPFDKVFQNGFESDAMQGIAWMRLWFRHVRFR